MQINYYLYGKKANTTDGYGQTKISGKFEEEVAEALKAKSRVRARTSFSISTGDYRVIIVNKHPDHHDIIFIKLD